MNSFQFHIITALINKIREINYRILSHPIKREIIGRYRAEFCFYIKVDPRAPIYQECPIMISSGLVQMGKTSKRPLWATLVLVPFLLGVACFFEIFSDLSHIKPGLKLVERFLDQAGLVQNYICM